MTNPIVRRVIKAAGTQAALAAQLGITRSAVSQWKSIPAWHLAKVSQVTGIPITELLPAHPHPTGQQP